MFYDINDYVCVRLTSYGVRRLHDYYLRNGGLANIILSKSTHPDGWSQFQLWELMNIYGKDMFFGNGIAFHPEIWIGTLEELQEHLES